MRRVVLLLIVLAMAVVPYSRATIAGAGSSGGGRAWQDEIAEVKRVEAEAAAAYDRNDADALDRLWASDYTFVNPGGVVLDKAQRLATLKTGSLHIESYTVDDMRVRIYGATAIVLFRSSVAGTRGGNDITSRRRVTTVLIKRDGRWQIVAQQSTPIAGG